MKKEKTKPFVEVDTRFLPSFSTVEMDSAVLIHSHICTKKACGPNTAPSWGQASVPLLSDRFMILNRGVLIKIFGPIPMAYC